MKETMHSADGIGLAAIQVGVMKRALIVEANNMFLEVINPTILGSEGEQIGPEGCLSIPGVNGNVKRPEVLSVKAFDRYGNTFIITATGLLAIVLSHEIDHLDGILFTDKAEEIFEKEK